MALARRRTLGHRCAVTDTEDLQWLIFKGPDGGEVAAPIHKELDAAYVVLRDGAQLTLRKDRGRQRRAAHDSLDLLSVREPDALNTLFQSDPVGLLVRALHEWRSAFTKEQIVDRMARLGVMIDPSQWKKLQPKLAKHPNVLREGTTITYRWVEARSAEASVKEVLLALHDPKKAAKDGDSLKRQLGALVEHAELSSSERVLASAIVPQLARPQWEDFKASEIDPDLAPQLIALATAEKAWDFLASLALEPTASARSAAADAALQTAGPEAASAALAREVRRLSTKVVPGPDLAATLKRLEPRLPLVRRSIPERPTTQLIASLLELCLAVPRSSDAEGAAVVRRWALEVSAGAVENRSDLVRAVRSVDPTPKAMIAAVAGLSSDPFAVGGARIEWLGALSQWQPTQASVQDTPELWTGVTLDDLSVLDGDPDLGPLLTSPLARQLIVGQAIEQSLERDPDNLRRVLNLPTRQLDQVPEALISQTAARVDPASPLGRALAATQRAAVETITAQQDVELNALQAKHALAVQQLEHELRARDDLVRAADARRDRLAAEVDQLRAHSTGSSEAQLRQAQMDSLRAMADLLYDALKALPGVESGSVAAEEVASRLRRLASQAGVTVHAMPGDVVGLDRQLYRPLSEEGLDPAAVVVVDPAITTTTAEGVTLLRYGSVTAGT